MKTRLMALQKQLAATIGKESAYSELKWMQAALRDKSAVHQRNDLDAELQSWVDRRTSGEPLQYILGTQPFGRLEILTRAPVLIPRPETEYWVNRLSERFHGTLSPETPISLLDLCTGTGCIPLLLSHIWPAKSVRALAVDVSSDAIALAKENREKSGTNGSEVEFRQGDIFDDDFIRTLSRPGMFDVLTCNPPYIPAEEYAELPVSVREYEDRRALLGEYPIQDTGPRSVSETPDTNTGKSDGLSFYRRLARVLPYLLKPKGGMFVLEFGAGQGAAVRGIITGAKAVSGNGKELVLQETEIWEDQFGRERAFAGRT